MLKAKLLAGGGAETIYVDDVFSAYTYTGTGVARTITNGIDLANEGGLLWNKARSTPGTGAHFQVDTVRGNGFALSSSDTTASGANANVTSFNSDGYSLDTFTGFNRLSELYVSWTFRQSPKFFSQATATVTGGVDATVSFSDLATLGMVAVKRTDSTGSWYVWHRSLTAGKLLYLEQTAAEATLGHITVSGTTVTLEGGVIANGTYIVYAWAHDTGTDGLIQCGSFTTDGSGNATVSLGWEPQYLMVKASSTTFNWQVVDSSREFTVGNDNVLSPNTTAAEGTTVVANPTATGFYATTTASQTLIYLAIRRPNKPPTLGTQVYQAIARTGTGAAATVTGVGFAPDLVALHSRSGTTGGRWEDRLRGATQELVSETTAAEASVAQSITSFSMDGFVLGTDGDWNTNTATYINWCFKRAPGVFDVACYTGTGAVMTLNHSLGVRPELLITKKRSSTGNWAVGVEVAGQWKASNTTGGFVLNASTSGIGTYSISGTLTATTYTSTDAGANYESTHDSGATYVTYLFATKAGISKVGSYTGTATTKQIDCDFTTGARFVLIKRTDSTGDWYVWDTVRGIIAGNDPYLLLNSTAAEVTSTDYIDSYTSGFELSSTAPAAINASGGTFIYLAFA